MCVRAFAFPAYGGGDLLSLLDLVIYFLLCALSTLIALHVYDPHSHPLIVDVLVYLSFNVLPTRFINFTE